MNGLQVYKQKNVCILPNKNRSILAILGEGEPRQNTRPMASRYTIYYKNENTLQL